MNTRTTITTLLAVAGLALAAVPARAALTTPIVSLTGSHGGDGYANGMISLTNGSGITKTIPADPATWTFSGANYQDEWMANYLAGASNSKLAWAAFDLGVSTSLTKLWLFNNNYGGGPSGVNQYNLYYADSPAVALPAQPNKGAYSVTGLTPQGDYNFSSGGWTKFNTSGALSATATGINSVDLTGISARYLAVEILSNHGDTYGGGRVGFDEVAVTVTPTVPSIIATSPASGATNALASDPLWAKFSLNIAPGTSNITLRNLTDSTDTVIPIGDPRISISGNLLTINPVSALDWSKNYAVRIDPGAVVSDTAVSFAGITDDTTWSFTTAASDRLLTALAELKSHITGAITLSAAQIEAHKLTIDADKNRFATSAAIIAAAFDLVTTFDTVKGALWVVQGLPARASVINDLNWTIYTVMQDIMDLTYNAANIANHESLFNGFKFGSSASFPGPCAPPANSNQTYTATISASYSNTVGRATQGDGPGTFARKPTGCYLAPGSIATVTVPPALVGKGYLIRVGANSWDYSNKPNIKRLDRSTIVYSIDTLATKIASPLGGGIYIEVPWLANAGVVNVQIRNAVRSPFFSAKSFHTTTPTQWLTERANTAPWADFQSDKFMMQVPTSWISAMPDPTQLMADWDTAMDAVNDLMGFPRIRGKESFYTQVDQQIRASVFAPGYPSVNVGGFSATANYGGYANHYLVRGPQNGIDANTEFHEQGHGYFFPKFGGESESEVNLLYVPAMQRLGKTLDEAFRASVGSGNTYQTLDTTAMAWMCTFNFSPREQPMAQLEKQYQLKGHAKFVDIARLFGWSGLNAYWASFTQDEESGVSSPTDTDGMLLRLCQSVGKDIRPLFHFWGIYPQNPSTLAAAIAAAGIPSSPEIRNRLLYYKTLVPANNAAFRTFALAWWGHKPLITGYWEETDHAMQWDETVDFDPGGSTVRPNGDIYVEASAADIQGRVQELVDLYFDTTPPTVVTLSPADNATGVAAGSNLVVTFNETIALGAGNITLKNLTDQTQLTIAVTDGTQVSVAGAVLTINPTANLAAGKAYAIRIDATAIKDVATNSFAGIADDMTWNFATAAPDTTTPAISTLSPADNATGVAAGSNLVVTFNETIALGAGNITLKNLTDATQLTIAVTDGTQVSVAGAVLTINPAANLAAGKAYAIRIDATAIKDLANNPFAGIADDTTWNFTTATVPQTVPVAAVTGSHGGDQYAANGMNALVNGSGMSRPDLADPSTWTVNYTNYPDEWMANGLSGALNGKRAWVAFDLGASTALHQLHLWSIRYQAGIAGTATYNLYYADSPTVALPAQPNKGAYSVTGRTPQGDYDFSGGGWTKFNPSGALSAPKAGNSIVDLSGVSARYVALEILTNYGDTYGGGRVGFLETALTRAISVTTPPILSGFGPLIGSSFPLTFSGPSGQGYKVLSSTNVALPLSSWTVMTTNTFGAGSVTYTNTSATNKQQFYRIQSP